MFILYREYKRWGKITKIAIFIFCEISILNGLLVSISRFNDLFLGNIILGLIALITGVGTMIVPIFDIVN